MAEGASSTCRGMCLTDILLCGSNSPQSETRLTKKELLALAAEMEGTLEGEEKAEEKREEDERWARFTDANPRGAGNTMNRG